MSVDVYEQFEKCRNSNFLSKGKNVLLNHLGIKCDSKKRNEYNQDIENLAFILKFIIKSCIDIVLLNKG